MGKLHSEGRGHDRGAEERSPVGARRAGAVLGAVAVGGLVFIAWVALWAPRNLGIHDWDYFFHVYEAVRISFSDYGQFPWWNIWSCGGLPLFANPQVGVFSASTLFVLLFGTVMGLKLSLVLHMLFGFEGMRRLLRRYVSGPFALFGAACFIGCGGLALAATAGHFSAITIYYLPWLIHFAVGLPEGKRYGWLFGLTMAAMALEAVHYQTVYAGGIGAAVALWMVIQSKGKRWLVGRRVVIAFSVFLLLAGFRLGVSAVYVSQCSETAGGESAVLAGRNLEAFFVPITDPGYRHPETTCLWLEYGCYVGPAVLALLCFSLLRGVRYWHLGVALCLWAAQSLTVPWSPSYWLNKIPLFEAMRGVTRWRIPAALFIAMGAAAGADALWARSALWKKGMRLVLAACCLFALIDMFWVSGQIMAGAFPGPPLSGSARLSAQASDFLHIRGTSPVELKAGPMFLATRANVGVVNGYEPLFGYKRDRSTLVRARGEPDYKGEATMGGQLVRPAYWSPNRIVFENLDGPIRLNLAPGSYWRVNGRNVFAHMRIVEMTEPFFARPDASGRVVLSIVPSGWRLGTGLSLLGVVSLAAIGTITCVGRHRRRPLQPQESCDSPEENANCQGHRAPDEEQGA